MAWVGGTLKTFKQYILKLLNNNCRKTGFWEGWDFLIFVVFQEKNGKRGRLAV